VSESRLRKSLSQRRSSSARTIRSITFLGIEAAEDVAAGASVRPWEKTFVDEKRDDEERSATTVKPQIPGRRGKKTDLYLESMWVSASSQEGQGLSKYPYLREFLSMYQVGSTLMSRHHLVG